MVKLSHELVGTTMGITLKITVGLVYNMCCRMTDGYMYI